MSDCAARTSRPFNQGRLVRPTCTDVVRDPQHPVRTSDLNTPNLKAATTIEISDKPQTNPNKNITTPTQNHLPLRTSNTANATQAPHVPARQKCAKGPGWRCRRRGAEPPPTPARPWQGNPQWQPAEGEDGRAPGPPQTPRPQRSSDQEHRQATTTRTRTARATPKGGRRWGTAGTSQGKRQRGPDPPALTPAVAWAAKRGLLLFGGLQGCLV